MSGRFKGTRSGGQAAQGGDGQPSAIRSIGAGERRGAASAGRESMPPARGSGSRPSSACAGSRCSARREPVLSWPSGCVFRFRSAGACGDRLSALAQHLPHLALADQRAGCTSAIRRCCSPMTSCSWRRCCSSPAGSPTPSPSCSSSGGGVGGNPAPTRTLWLGGLALALAAVLAFFRLPLPWHGAAPLELPPLYIAGMWVAVACCVVFSALYSGRTAAESRQMSNALPPPR